MDEDDHYYEDENAILLDVRRSRFVFFSAELADTSRIFSES